MSTSYDDWVHVVPAPGELSATARELLDLAGDPMWVRTVGNGTEFLVHPDVAAAFAARRGGAEKTPRRRGRAPRLTTEE